MYLIDVSIKEKSSDPSAAEHLKEHQNWFGKYFDEGKFLMVGPSKTYELSGVILAQVKNREELDQILSEDVYFPNDATYEVNEYVPSRISKNITMFEGK